MATTLQKYHRPLGLTEKWCRSNNVYNNFKITKFLITPITKWPDHVEKGHVVDYVSFMLVILLLLLYFFSSLNSEIVSNRHTVENEDNKIFLI